MFGNLELGREKLLKQILRLSRILKHERVGAVQISSGKSFHIFKASFEKQLLK